MNKKIKILQVIDQLNVGGAEQICITLTNLLYANQHLVSLLTLVDEGNLKSQLDPNIDILKLNRRYPFDLVALFKCAKILKQFDIIHVHMRHNYRYIKLIHQLFFLKNKIILHDHYGNIDKDLSIPTGFKWGLRPRYYIGVSGSLVNWAENILKLKKSNVFLLRNIVLKKEVLNSTATRSGLVLVGNIKPIKNQLFAIQLMEQLDTTLTIYGSIQDDAYFQKLLQEIERLKITHKIIFKHNCVEIQKELHQFEIGLQTAISESGPLVVIEYLAQSLPFISYNTGEVISLIEKELPNYILNNFSKNDWVQRIQSMRKEQNLVAIENIYSKYFSEKVFLTNCLSIYNRILK